MPGITPAMAILLSLLVGAEADVYMQYPPGGNNRLDEGGGNRNNNNRLMDTQNNGKGGYGYGGDKDNVADNLKYMVGSELTMEWTSQHSCGGPNNQCDIIIQTMCNADADGNTPAGYVEGKSYCSNYDIKDPTDCTDADNTWVTLPGAGEGPLRDGTDQTTPDPNNPDATTGLHEPGSFYKDCEARERNKGLYTADQNVKNNKGATATRQNPNGDRSGQECAEERDYYPYWHPAGWKDVAIMTNDLARCEVYKLESQNVKAKNYCSNPKKNNEADCLEELDEDTSLPISQWLEVAAHGIPAPECLSAPEQRDNHLGNVETGNNVVYKWTVPYGLGVKSCTDRTLNGEADCTAGGGLWLGDDDATNCVVRLRYNITTADTKTCSTGASVTEEPDGGAKVCTGLCTEAACLAGGGLWSNAYINAAYNVLVDKDGKAENGDLNLNANGNQNPGLLKQDPDVDMGGFLTDTGGKTSLLELAVNTNQYGRTFQDRSHTFTVQSRPSQIGAATKIYNLNVRGKRGNIVQTYPATEYDFAPVKLEVGASDMVHIQWTGNDDTNNNGNNNGEGTDSEDRHNIVQLDNSGKAAPKAYAQGGMFDVSWEWNPDTSGTFGGARDEKELTMQAALAKQTGCLTEDDIDKDQQRQNCQKLNAASATIDLGLMKFKPGEYKYMSSRNNNFSNRAQKASITVTDLPSVPPDAAENVQVEAIESGNENEGALRVTWTKPGLIAGAEGNPIGFDGIEYPNSGQSNVDVIDYKVSYSTDGGKTWISAGNMCSGTIYECTITGLPAGTTVGVVVQAGGTAGYGAYSTETFGETQSSQTSRECEATLRAQAEGTWISPGTIVAIIFSIIAFFLLVGGGVYIAKHRKPPPPPGGVHNPGKAGY